MTMNSALFLIFLVILASFFVGGSTSHDDIRLVQYFFYYYNQVQGHKIVAKTGIQNVYTWCEHSLK